MADPARRRRSNDDDTTTATADDATAAICELLLHVPMGSRMHECVLLLELYQRDAATTTTTTTTAAGDASLQQLLLGSATVTGSQLRDLTRHRSHLPTTSASAMVHLFPATAADATAAAMGKKRQLPSERSGVVGPGVVGPGVVGPGVVGPGPVSVVSLQLRRSSGWVEDNSSSSSFPISLDDHSLVR